MPQFKHQLNTRLPHVGTTIFTVMSQLAQECGALNLSQGFPDYAGPRDLLAAVTRHMEAGDNQYAAMAGAWPLREAIAEKVSAHYAACYDTGSEITVTAGATQAIFSAISCMVHPGDEVIVFDPAYDSYCPIIELVGGRAIRIPLLRPEFSIDWDRLSEAITQRTRLLIINFPHNPTGAILSREDLDRLADLLRSTKVFVISDEVYEHMVFDGHAHQSINAHHELSARSVVVSSFGKTYHATGWKVGYTVAPAALTTEVRKVHQFLTFSTASVLQYAIADFMLAHPEWEEQLAAFYQTKRDRLQGLLRGSRFQVLPARSTYFQLLDYSAISDAPDTELSIHLIKVHGVTTIPVSPFCEDPPSTERLIRLCFAKQDATLSGAAERLLKL